MKKCPYCAEEIKDAAIVCRYCGRDLTLPVPLPTVAQRPTLKYELVRRRPSPWRQGAKAAAVLAVLQIVLSVWNGEDVGLAVFTTVLVFFPYWLFFTFIVWLWRVFTRRV